MTDIHALLRRCHEGPDVPTAGELEEALREAHTLLEWQGEMTEALLPYQERAVKAEVTVDRLTAALRAIADGGHFYAVDTRRLAQAALEDKTHCGNQLCECHTNPARAVLTPFPVGLGPPHCCSRCARTGGSV